MFGQDHGSSDFLSAEEAAAVEGALLSSRDKFTTRVAIYSLRVLKQIAREQEVAIAQVSPEQITEWVEHDEALKTSSVPGLETDDSFKTFFSRLVGSSLKPLHQISQETGTPLDQLSVQQVIQWFEKEAKERIEAAQNSPSS